MLLDGVNKGQLYVSAYEGLTVNIFKITPHRAGIEEDGINFEWSDYWSIILHLIGNNRTYIFH